jgi:hypothetical protein
MELATFHADVAVALGRGSSLDAKIVGWTRTAARALEQIIDFAHMQRFALVELNPVAANPDLVNFPNVRVKKFTFIRQLLPSGEYQYLEADLPQTVLQKTTGNPTRYWHDGTATIHLNAKIEVATTLETLWLEYTDWPTATDTTPTLLERGYDALFSWTMLIAAQSLRDDRMAGIFTLRRDEAVQIARATEAELQQASTTYRMKFSNAGH